MLPEKDYLETRYRKKLFEHTALVNNRMSSVGRELCARGRRHDNSAYDKFERSIMEKEDYLMCEYPMGSEVFEEAHKRAQVAVSHHYRENDHHPEHFDNGIKDMDMLQIIEWLSDIMAEGAQEKKDPFSILNNRIARYSIDSDLANILKNTMSTMQGLLR